MEKMNVDIGIKNKLNFDNANSGVISQNFQRKTEGCDGT